MTNIQVFNDTDEMFASIRRGVEQAKSNTLPRQWAITHGDYWLRVWEDFIIFGYIHTTEELDAEEIRLGATPEELEYEHEAMKYSYDNGFRFGTAYSVVEPRGELGDTHVSSMVPITKEEFESARELNWNSEEIINLPWFDTAVERLMLGV